MKEDSENKKKSELKTRTRTALILLPIVAAVVYAGGAVFGFAVALLLVQMLREFYAMQKHGRFSRLAVATIITATFCCASLLYLEQIGFLPLIWLACVIGATDIGAFFAGRAFGKHKICHALAPIKLGRGRLAVLHLRRLFLVGLASRHCLVCSLVLLRKWATLPNRPLSANLV